MLSAKDDIIDYIILEENKRKIYHTFRTFSKIQLKLVDFILFLVFQRHFQQYFSYNLATSFSGGGSRRKPPTMGKQLVNFITCGCESSAPFL
jgi:hypothetical protein